MTDKLPVIFRAERRGSFKGHVTAVFPTLPGTPSPHSFTTYAHVGQHGTGSKEWYFETRAAQPAEYADLLAELRHIYENPNDNPVELVVAHRFTQGHDAARRQALKEMTR